MYTPGTLVRSRSREWVVLPESEDDFLIVRPLGGTDNEIAGIDTRLEAVEPATFALPDPTQLGDHRSCRILRDAIRLGFRSSAGPFRSLGKIAVQPRAYQYVPLLMALRQETVRLLIADDVGIGKTVEALMIAKELLERGEVHRMAVLCPPHLAEQWKTELFDKFHINAELILASTARRLDKYCGNRSVFDVFPFVVVSLDYIKSENRRDEFIRSCPELVIVDEAHTCTALGVQGNKGTRQQRHEVIRKLAANSDRHMLFVTATPHSGNEQGFRSLLQLLNANFEHLPDDLSGDGNRKNRENLAKHFVQRRRKDIEEYLANDAAFPTRLEREETYKLEKSEYRQLFERLLDYARGVVRSSEGMSRVRQRVRWWAALALLRALASSPAAAAATLRSKLQSISAETPEEVDLLSRPLVLDEDTDEAMDAPDVTAGADISDLQATESEQDSERRRLLDMAQAADKLEGDGDPKLKKIVPIIKDLLNEGHRPILFCRFIATAEYLAEQLRARLPKDTTVISVTGLIPPDEREKRIAEGNDAPKAVLVCTDCLSEGINLQHQFSAVIHYDLSWNPTRHEQREGRVDRFGQPKPEVKVLTYYGIDNQIDGVVLNVLINKHKKIRAATGVSVPVPATSNSVLEALYEGLLLRDRSPQQLMLEFEDPQDEKAAEFSIEWQNAADREKKSRSLFAQHTIKPDEVASEVSAALEAIGSNSDLKNFVTESVRSLGGTCTEQNKRFSLDLTETPRPIRESIGQMLGSRRRGAVSAASGSSNTTGLRINARFDPVVNNDEEYLSRTHPVVESLTSYVMDSALDSTAGMQSVARRCGAIRTDAVTVRTTLLLLRLRYHILVIKGDDMTPLLAEDSLVVGFESAPSNARWLHVEQAEKLLTATPTSNITPDIARESLEKILREFNVLQPQLNEIAESHGKRLLDSHQRVRTASQRRHIRYGIEPQLPPDVLGVYLYLPSQ
jgi:ERCC4-related helicase